MKAHPSVAACAVALAALGGVASAQTAEPSAGRAVARLVDTALADVGTVELTATPNGVLVRAVIERLPAGTHGFHVHETGACEPPFESAGGHFNPTGADHGFKIENGPHAGDLVNLDVPENGEVVYETINPMISLGDAAGGLFDADGSSIMVHEHADDYSTAPSGDAGGRLACGVIEKAGAGGG